MVDPATWTYGAEHEYGDWDRRRGLPEGKWYEIPGFPNRFYSDPREAKCMNSNGIASSPVYPYGGEVNTPYTRTPEGQGAMVTIFRSMHPEATVNYRSALHAHVRVPGLKADLPALKRLAAYQSGHGRDILEVIEPYESVMPDRDLHPEAFRRWYHRANYRTGSHRKLLDEAIVLRLLSVETVPDFIETVRPPGGWQFFRRPAVNLFRMFPETAKDHVSETIEFRHFPGSLDPEVVAEALRWCRDYLLLAFSGADPAGKLAEYRRRGLLPMPFPPYSHDLEKIFQETCSKDKLSLPALREKVERYCSSVPT
jgi:hypothetical protein